jgi:ribosomal protein S27AE
MAKKRKPTGASAGKTGQWPLGQNEVAENINHIMESMDTYTKHRIECGVCGASDTTRDETEGKFARGLYADGWRYVTSEKFGMRSVMCPKCSQTPDDDRGE